MAAEQEGSLPSPSPRRGSETEISRTVVGADTAKRVFQPHRVDMETGEIVDPKLTRAKFLERFANLAPCVVAMEAGGGSQHSFIWYNFCRQHKSLKCSSPAMAAGVSKTLRDMEWIVGLIDARTPKPNRPKTYRKYQNSNWVNIERRYLALAAPGEEKKADDGVTRTPKALRFPSRISHAALRGLSAPIRTSVRLVVAIGFSRLRLQRGSERLPHPSRCN